MLLVLLFLTPIECLFEFVYDYYSFVHKYSIYYYTFVHKCAMV